MILHFDNSAYFDLSSILHRPYNNATELQTKVATPRVNNRPYMFRSTILSIEMERHDPARMFHRQNYNSNIDLSWHFQCLMNHF